MKTHIPLTTFAIAVFVCGCGGEDKTSFSEVRTVESPAAQSSESGVTNPHAGGAMPMQTASAGPLQWTTPEGWSEKAASSMRIINLGVEGEPAVECYVTRLGGTGGGLDANLNRWRGQLSLPPYTAEEIAALPTINILGDDAVFVEMEGTYTGMGNTDAQEGFALLGAVAEADGATYFVKMTGPADVLARERDKFTAFCESLDTGGGTAMAATSAPADPHAGVPGMSSSGSLSWTAPDGWQLIPARPMREVTFAVNGAECYVSTLSGRAGGAAANINRWRTQMAQQPLSPEELAALETITVLGEPSPLVTIEGPYTGMSGVTVSDAMLLGVVREDDTQSVFIKMTGPKDVVESERANFITFCESLK